MGKTRLADLSPTISRTTAPCDCQEMTQNGILCGSQNILPFAFALSSWRELQFQSWTWRCSQNLLPLVFASSSWRELERRCFSLLQGMTGRIACVVAPRCAHCRFDSQLHASLEIESLRTEGCRGGELFSFPIWGTVKQPARWHGAFYDVGQARPQRRI